MYTIRQAALRTGITIPTIRVWERRYGVVAPTRTPGGYRLYDDESIARLNAMQHLVEHEGWRPSQAAERVRMADPAELAELGAPEPKGPQRMTEDRQQAEPVGAAVSAIVDGARELDVRSIEQALDEAFAAQRFEAAMDAVVFPALRAVGDAWSRDELDVAREHAASETIRRRIAHYFDAASQNVAGPTIVVGLPPGSRHELGAFAFAVAARRAGCDVVYLGADVPLEAWLRAVRDRAAAAAVIAIVRREDVRPAVEVVRALRDDDVRLVAVGGPSVDRVPDDVGAVRLHDGFDMAIPELLEAIGQTTR
jgi:DNA-binding transcriptional MerR regulator/methylmalonyl-CoA mutase cobalamin-binding subunit